MQKTLDGVVRLSIMRASHAVPPRGATGESRNPQEIPVTVIIRGDTMSFIRPVFALFAVIFLGSAVVACDDAGDSADNAEDAE